MKNGLDDNLDFRRNIDPDSLYELESLLGEGSYGAVYQARVRDSKSNEKVAIKILPDADEDLTALGREIRFLQVLRSPFVVSFIESLLFDNELWLVMELCDGGSLYDLKEAMKCTFREPHLKAIIAFSTLGLAHLHAQRSIHRDVKSGNILLTRDGRAKLGDFGISAQLTDTINKRRTVIGSPYWMAPEVIQESSYDGKADIWSLGITILELCEGKPPHFDIHPMRAIFIISSRPAPTFKEPAKWSKEMQDFLGQCLVKDCDERASAAELLKHPWISKTVKEIGSNGKGLPILEDLLIENWDNIELSRTSKLPDNLPLTDDGQQIVSEDYASLDGNVNVNFNGSGSLLRRNNSFGIPATRQQLRNASLSRSQTPTNGRSRSASSSANYLGHTHVSELEAGDIGTLVTRPLNNIKSNFSEFKDMPQYKLDDSFDQKNSNETSFDNSLVRKDGTLVSGSVKRTKPHLEQSGDKEGDSQEIQAALKYFRDEPLPNIPDPKNPKKTKSREEKERIDAQKINDPSPNPKMENETSVLNSLTNNQKFILEENQVEALKQEIMRQLSILKKQYKEDLESLTNKYESRRKGLKEALLALSNSQQALPQQPTVANDSGTLVRNPKITSNTYNTYEESNDYDNGATLKRKPGGGFVNNDFKGYDR